MHNRDLMALTLAITFNHMLSILFGPIHVIIHYLIPYFVGCLIYLLAIRPHRTAIYYVIFNYITSLPGLINTYYIFRSSVLPTLFLLSDIPLFKLDLLLASAGISAPFLTYVEIIASRKTIEKLKLRKRIGYI